MRTVLYIKLFQVELMLSQQENVICMPRSSSDLLVTSMMDQDKHYAADNTAIYDVGNQSAMPSHVCAMSGHTCTYKSNEKLQMKANCVSEINTLHTTLTLFPFVCGLCYEKFDNLLNYYSHLRECHKETDTYFHNHEADLSTGNWSETELYHCGKCSFVSPSLCQLHEHLVNVEKVSVYKLFTHIKTAYPCSWEEKVGSILVSSDSASADKDTGKTNTLGEKMIFDHANNEIDLRIPEKGVLYSEGNRSTIDHGCKMSQLHYKLHSKFSVDSSECNRLENKWSGHLRNLDDNQSVVHTKTSEAVCQDVNICENAKIRTSGIDTDNVCVQGAQEVKQSESETGFITITKHIVNPDKASEGICVTNVSNIKVNAKTNVSKKKVTTRKRKTLMKDSDGNPVYANNTLVPCEKCGRKIRRRCMKYHMACHSETRDFPCDICGFKFKSSDQLKQHRRTVHTSGDSCVCEVCGKVFKNIPYLRQHEETHAERDKKCSRCPQAFRTVKLLRRHMLVHEDERQHKCEVCKKEFTYKSGLTEHIRSVHNDERAYACEVCGKTFKLWRGLRKHKRIHKPPNHFCSFCEKGFAQLYNLKIHLKIHTKHINKGDS